MRKTKGLSISLTRNSKNATNPTTARTCAILAITAPNLTQRLLKPGPRNTEMKKRTNRTAAFHTIGPRAITPIRIRGLGRTLPSTANDPTNM